MTEFVTKKECLECRQNKTMSPETKENLNILAQANMKMQESVENIKEAQISQVKDIEYIKLSIGEIKDFIKDSPQKFASKHVEKVVYAGIGLGIAFILNKLFNLI